MRNATHQYERLLAAEASALIEAGEAVKITGWRTSNTYKSDDPSVIESRESTPIVTKGVGDVRNGIGIAAERIKAGQVGRIAVIPGTVVSGLVESGSTVAAGSIVAAHVTTGRILPRDSTHTQRLGIALGAVTGDGRKLVPVLLGRQRTMNGLPGPQGPILTVAAAISASATSITLSGSVVHGTTVSGAHTLRIGDEDMTVSGRSGNTYTVIRGRNGTTAAAHAVGAIVHVRRDNASVAQGAAVSSLVLLPAGHGVGTRTYSATGLPAGATFAAGSRTLAGTVSATAAARAYDITVKVEDEVGQTAEYLGLVLTVTTS